MTRTASAPETIAPPGDESMTQQPTNPLARRSKECRPDAREATATAAMCSTLEGS